MPPASDMPRRGRSRRPRLPVGRRRAILIVFLVAAFMLATSLRGLAGFYTDYLWFQSLDLTSVWRGVVGAKFFLVTVFTVTAFTLTWVNVLVAERLSGRTIRFGGSSEDELVLKYRELVGRRSAVVRGAVAALIGLAAGGGTASQWNNWVLLRNHVPFGTDDATFGHDIGFYVFQLPFLRFVVGWVFSALVVVTVIALVFHYLNGGIRLQAAQERVAAPVKAHISVLLAALALVRAGQYHLDRFELVYSRRGPVDGAGYTDVNVQMPAINLLVMISIFSMVLFLVNIRRRGWVLPVLAVGIWALVAVLAGEAVPALVQRFRVDSRPSALEAPYVDNNITATRAAMGLDGVDEQDFSYDYGLSGEDLLANADTVSNIRLWDPAEIKRAFVNQQGLREFYDITDVDVDRYTVDGEARQMMVGARTVDDDGLPAGSRGWEQSRLVYTSGYGVVMAPANAKSGAGQPDFTVSNIPSRSDAGYPEVDNPYVYFGENLSGYKIVDTSRTEQLEDGANERAGGYNGRDGVALDGFFRRAAFSLRFNEIEPLTSGSIRSSSRVLLQRDVRGRVQELAPFLALDADPYPVVLDGRVVYVIDAYTTTDRYPNAQQVAIDDDLPTRSGLRGRRFNYVRNSVKAVVDAYEGTVDLYVTDEDDPLVQAYQRAFPDLFASFDDLPAGLEEHMRYPEDLFRVQTAVWGRYHITQPDAFLNDEGSRWAVAAAPTDPDSSAPTTATTAPATTTTAPTRADGDETRGRIEPTYQLLRLPGEEDESFVMVRPFTVRNRAQLSAFLTATPDGSLASFSVPSAQGASGPSQIASRIQSESEVGELRAFFRDNLTFGNVLLVPIEQSVVYVQSVYVTTDDQTRIQAVIVAYQDGADSIEVAVGNTLNEALVRVFGDAPDTLEADPDPEEPDIDDLISGQDDPDPGPDADPPEDPPTDSFSGTEEELIAAIQAEFDAADQALADGEGLAGYQEHIDRAEELIDLLAQRRGEADEGGATTTAPSEGDSTTTTPSSTPPDADAGDAGTTTPAAPSTTRPSA